ncbi:MAG TPA: GTPase domain-containing protein [Polyangiaceae bacterium]|jgi:hypothetical protein|nr:GTPase domain-containing protein [Polyangiaceae bacterium]
MATIDDTRGTLVIRIVYDGPALSGKTTSLGALARGVNSTVECPDHTDGRTLFFDWVEYVGGLFEGRQIRCQIVSVPGQIELGRRRKMLLEAADAIVLVLDTREHEWQFGLGWLKDVLPFARAKTPPVGVVLQANKRDAPDAVPKEELRQALLPMGPVPLVESSAASGDGIREAFVLAVRVALDRVRALAAAGQLEVGRPAEETPDALLARMHEMETDQDFGEPRVMRVVEEMLGVEAEPWHRAGTVAVSASGDAVEERPFIPDPMMPGGMIWPPVDGRALLHDVASLEIRPARTSRADWLGAGSGFRFHSFGGALYADPHVARNELIEWARLHAANSQYLSAGRAVILADAGAGRLRLWQLVRTDAALREPLSLALGLADPAAVAQDLMSVATELAAAREAFRASSVALPCTLWSVGQHRRSLGPTFVGLMPGPASKLAPEPEGRPLIERELSPHLRELRRSRVDYNEVVEHVQALAEYARYDTPARWLSDVVLAT